MDFITFFIKSLDIIIKKSENSYFQLKKTRAVSKMSILY